MLENIQVLYHSSIKINREKVIYIDPFKIDNEYHDADIIFITHSHFDHYSEEDIDKIMKENTKLIITEDLEQKVLEKVKKENVICVQPEKNYFVDGINFETIPAYNTNKQFHPKSNNWVGYIIDLNGTKYYFAGDTDITEENKKVKCDVAFVPVGGTYTMTYKEAVDLILAIKPKVAIPIHYKTIVGSKEDAQKFKELLKNDVEVKILMK